MSNGEDEDAAAQTPKADEDVGADEDGEDNGEGQVPEAGTPEKKEDYSIFIGNLDFSVTKAQLQRHFEVCGTIQRVTIAYDHQRHKAKGYAYIEFADEDGVTNALKLDGQLLEGRNLQVRKKRQTRPNMRSRSPRRRFRRRF